MKNDDINLLIDAVVRQTVVLIAHLATTQGKRAPLANVANQVFLGLVRELSNQGVTQTVSADMFGMALRTYQRRKQRILESATETGRSLWEAVYAHLQEQGSATRVEIASRFSCDDENVLRGVLHDLVEAGFVARSGRGYHTRYIALQEEEILKENEDLRDTKESLLWVSIYRNGPITAQQLHQLHALAEPDMEAILHTLCEDGRVTRQDTEQEPHYTCDTYLIPFGASAGWAASVFDHYQAMVGAICHKLRQEDSRALRRDVIGGSTFAFDLWDGHPFEEEVLNLLSEQRERAQTLRERVDKYNAGPGENHDLTRRVLFYLGQNVIDEHDQEPGE